jgi:hypothetical protein
VNFLCFAKFAFGFDKNSFCILNRPETLITNAKHYILRGQAKAEMSETFKNIYIKKLARTN